MELNTHSWISTNNADEVFVGLHGAESHAEWFKDLATTLNRGNFDFISYDRFGSGNTSQGYSGLNKELKRLNFLVDCLNEKYKKVHIVAISWGCLFSYTGSRTYFKKVSSIHLIAPAFFPLKNLSLLSISRVLTGALFPSIRVALPFDAKDFSHSNETVKRILNDPLNRTKRCSRFYVDSFVMFIKLIFTKHIDKEKIFAYLPTEDQIVDLNKTTRYLSKHGIKTKPIKGSHALILDSHQKLASEIIGNLINTSPTLKYRSETLPFRINFKHAHKSRNENLSLFLKISVMGCHGYGEALYRDYLVGESIDDAIKDLKTFWPKRIESIPFDDLDGAIEKLKEIYLESLKLKKLSTFTAIDLASYSLLSQIHDISLEKLLKKQTKDNPSTTSTNPVATVPELRLFLTRLLIKTYKLMGYSFIKLKVSPKSSAKTLKLINTFKGHLNFIIDTNKSVSLEEMQTIPSNIVLIEDPKLCSKEQTNIKSKFDDILLDEYVVSQMDLEYLINKYHSATVNIRLAKNGGFTGSLKLANYCLNHNIKTYQGSLVGESGLLAYYQSVLFRSIDPLYFECGFNNILLKNNPFRWNQPYHKQGLLKSLERPTVEPKPNPDLLNQLA